MLEKILTEVEKKLKVDKDIIVPVKKIWVELNVGEREGGVSLEDFIDILRRDQRFDFFEETESGPLNEGIINEESMERAGFFSGPRVMLKSRKPSQKEVGDVLLRKTQLIYDNLMKVWEIRPEDDEEGEDQLLEALAKTQKLLRTLRDKFPESTDREP